MIFFFWAAGIEKGLVATYRSSRLEVFCKNGVQLIKPQACNFFKKETLTQVFPVNFGKFLRTSFFIEHLWRLVSLPS